MCSMRARSMPDYSRVELGTGSVRGPARSLGAGSNLDFHCYWLENASYY